MGQSVLTVPQKLRRGGKSGDEGKTIAEAVEIINLMSRHLGVPDLGGLNVLDMGCGCKLTQAILYHDLPVGRYVGMDVYAELIGFLRENVADPRFEFHSLNLHNEMYNQSGEPLTDDTRLPVAEGSFDLICLFSVFTHLAPHDYVLMLKLLRHYIKPDGKLIFSLFVNEITAGGFGLADTHARRISEHGADIQDWKGPPDFIDCYPDKPLKAAMYSREYALRLVEGTGWRVESLNDPEPDIQHYMICTPC